MILRSLPEEFQKALPIIEKLEAAGYEAYFVGGSVRDVLLGKKIHDVDIATSAYPAEVKQLFHHTIDVGIEHGTILVLFQEEQYEITTFRTESTYQDYRRPDKVTFVRSLEEDLKRRDFTINALALKKNGEIVDLFSGIIDLDQKLIRAVGTPSERFHEDALRMMRAVRFSSQLDFSIEAETFKAITKHAALLEKISVERIHDEWIKLMKGKARERGITAFVESGCYQYCPQLSGKAQELRQLAQMNPQFILADEALIWLLMIDCLELNEIEVVPFLKAWKNSNQTIQSVKIAYAALNIRKKADWNAWLLYQTKEKGISLVEQALDILAGSVDSQALARYQALPIHQLGDLAVNGEILMKHLGRTPGAWLGKTLHYLERSVVEGKLSNQPASLQQAAAQFIQTQGL